MAIGRIYNYVVHLAAWLAFFLAMAYLVPKPHFGYHNDPAGLPIWFWCQVPFLMVFFYLNRYRLIPNILARQKLVWYSLATGILYLVCISIPELGRFICRPDAFPLPPPPPPDVISIETLASTCLFLIIWIASTSQLVTEKWFSAESQRKEMAFEKSKTELSFLKAQINPHFLFNTLNNIYTLSLMKSDKATDSILKLADMMRYVLTEAGDKAVPLQQEIKYLDQFISLQRIRLTDRVQVQFDIFGEVENRSIAPFLLLPFVENAFKYGISTHQDCLIKIQLTVKKGELIFQTENRVFQEKLSREYSTGTGLTNLRRRLEILYPNRHWIRTETVGSTFFADLTIND
jgi:hypothetical protein